MAGVFMRTLEYPNAAFQTIESPRTSAIEIEGTPFSRMAFSISPVSTVLVLVRSNCPPCAAAGGAKSRHPIARRRSIRRVIVCVLG